jgi:hypothetical protein
VVISGWGGEGGAGSQGFGLVWEIPELGSQAGP